MNERDYDGLTMDYFQNQLLAKGITKEMLTWTSSPALPPGSCRTS